MLLASYTSGLRGNPGRQVRYLLPSTLEEAVKIAETVNQADEEENRREAFYLEDGRRRPRDTGSRRPRLRSGDPAKFSHRRKQGERDTSRARLGISLRDESKRYECHGFGHLARECPPRRKRQRSRVEKRTGEGAPASRYEKSRNTGRPNGHVQENNQLIL
jgi:hypothetical protein